jgi:transposase InsO family protein
MLLGHVLRFREGRVAVAADIREMFLRIKIREEDQTSQLFLWRESPEADVSTYKLTSMMFGARCSPASAQYVRDRVAEAAASTEPEAAAAIKTNFYMDDFLDARHTIEEATALAKAVTKVCAGGGFQLVNWASNKPAVLQDIPPEDRAVQTITIGGGCQTERVLGIQWDPERDVFLYDLDGLPKSSWPTKRQLLSDVMKTFDPLGFIGCVLIHTKILLQEVWRSGVGWDQPIQEVHANKWNKWLEEARSIRCHIPRCCREGTSEEAELHVFCDASESACCTAAYMVETTDNGPQTHFLGSKCKVAPLKPVSVPRLELQAALMGARFAETLKAEMNTPFTRVTLWTDSTTVLAWINADPRQYSVFVANRLGEIAQLTEPDNWRWVPTKQNPADVGTRDVEFPDLSPKSLWLTGPDFLTKPEVEWPTRRVLSKPAEELKQTVGLTTARESGLPDPLRMSSWRKLLRVTAWVLRITDGPRRHRTEVLTREELQRAETTWMRHMQADAFPAEVKLLQRGEPLPASSRIAKMSPRLQDGVVRADTRLESLGAEAPVILCATHPAARLLIRHAHKEVQHGGIERTVAEIRRHAVMLRLRTTARKMIHNCVKCRIQRGRPAPPQMAQLPVGRLAYGHRPFTHCGVDLFGPMEVTVGRRKEKRYGALFTCLSTRAVHLELVDKLDADATVMALRRMTARRGTPEVLYSDNGTNFRAADKEMKQAAEEIMKQPGWLNQVAKTSRWSFIPPASPHMGGAWERLVRSVKTGLRYVLKDRAPRLDTLLTTLAEIEHTINSRPLTNVSLAAGEEEPLTPNHFLIGSASGRPALAHYPATEEEVSLRRQWRIAQQLADAFWRRWLKEYVPTIARRQKWQKPSTPLKAGDLVIVADYAAHRNDWTRGRILEVKPAADGQVRAAVVKTSKGATLMRPAVKLVRLLEEDQSCPPTSE